VVELSEGEEGWGKQPETNPEGAGIGLSGEHLAYVMYTSGSTGRPKGVMVEHGAIIRLVRDTDYVQLNHNDVISQSSTISFDAATFEVWGALLNGARLVHVDKNVLLSPAILAEHFQRNKITALFLTTALFNQIAREATRAFDNLRYLLFGGERVAPEWVAHVLASAKIQNILHVYGPTETTTYATWHQVKIVEDAKTVPIGRPIANTKIYILDGELEPVPQGVAGELYIGGAGVARGYLNHPELTAEKFVPNLFGATLGDRLYRTGDFGRWAVDRTIEFIGRKDNQVKIRGHRIELGEIEGRLRECAGVGDAAVVVREEGEGEKRLVAYYTLGEGEGKGVGAEQLRAHVAAVMPEYMVPAAYVRMEELPLTINGKLDRKGLPAPEGEAFARRGYEAPDGEVETKLAEIWADLLQIERVGRRDNFFALGGHSLLAVRLIERMRRQAVQMDVQSLFNTTSLAELAATVVGSQPHIEVPEGRIPEGCAAITPEMLPLVELAQDEIDRIVSGVAGGAANVQDIYPLAPLQEGILFHYLMEGKGDPYLLGRLMSFDSRGRLDRYVGALSGVMERHDILRTAVVWEGLREPVQVVWRKAVLAVEEVELDATAEVAEQLYARFDPRGYRIDIRQAPLLRAYIAEDRENHRWLMMLLLHHLVGDHAAMEVMQREIEAYLLGRGERLAAPQPFRNLVAQARLGVRKEEHEAFFRKMLADIDEPTAPFGLLDVQGDGKGIEQARIPLDMALARRIRRQARQLGVSAASLCHVAWARVLAKVSGRDDVVFGTVLLGRMHGGIGADQVMGIFINTLPVRIDVGENRVAETVRRTHRLLADLLRHEHASLALAQRCSGVAAPTPLFSSLLNYRHNAGVARTSSEQQSWEGIEYLRSEEWSNYPWTLAVEDMGERFGLTAQTQTQIGANRVCAYMRTVLEGLVEALETEPARALCSLEVLPEEERRQVLYGWNGTEMEYPKDKCVPELFEKQVETTPEAVALVYEDACLTYRELNARANRLAHYLAGLGAGPEEVVGICMGRSLEMIIALMGILKAGAAYLALDPTYPPERMDYMLSDAGVSLVVVDEQTISLLPTDKLHKVNLESVWSLSTTSSSDNPDAAISSDNLAYLIYTSGSTGEPKGVAITHRALSNLIVAESKIFEIREGTIILQVSSLTFDAVVWEWITLLKGTKLILLPRESFSTGPELSMIAEKYQVEILTTRPGVLPELLKARMPALKSLMVGGEAWSLDQAKDWDGRVLLNGYGPTETTVTATVSKPLNIRDSNTIDSPPIGMPISNIQSYILDSHLAPVPLGAIGELYLGGVGVARGYWRRPELTAERFLPDPYAHERGARLYKTGDKVRYLPDGNLLFVGRVDDQVKIRGYRIEPREVEAILNRHLRVAQAAVVVREDRPGEKRLIGYVVCTPGESVNGTELRRYLGERLPGYMVPATVVVLERLPLMVNGKVDRKALPAPEFTSSSEYRRPQTPEQEILCALFAEVLGIERVGIEDNFFELGGHSLLATRLVIRVRAALEVDLSIRSLFESPTVQALTACLRKGVRTRPPLRRMERTQEVCLSYAQQRLWFIDKLEEGRSTEYNMQESLRLHGELDVDALERAINRIVERHESLRTHFVEIEGAPVQRIQPELRIEMALEDLSSFGEGEREERLKVAVNREGEDPFDLSCGPLLRVRLLKLGERDHILLRVMHHIVSDGWSEGVFNRELAALYEAFREGVRDPLPELEVQYADFAIWQRSWLDGGALDEGLKYWKGQLAGIPERLDLPTDRGRPTVQTFAGEACHVKLSAEQMSALYQVSRTQQSTLYMTLLTAFGVLLQRYSGQDDIVVGSPIANRHEKQLEEMIGFFLNTLAMRMKPRRGINLRELLGQVRETALEAYRYQEVPFERLVEELQPVRSMDASPLFQVMFALQNAPWKPQSMRGLEVEPVRGKVFQVRYDLEVHVWERDGGAGLSWLYNPDLMDDWRIAQMAKHYVRILEAMIADLSTKIEEVEILSHEERRELLYEGNTTEREYPKDKCVHELFELQAARSPETVAVVDEGQHLSYGELNRRANQLAHYLIGLGAGPEKVVGICLERSAELVVTLLGVLKTGAAYLPLDPGYPIRRLNYMVAETKPVCILSASSHTDTLSCKQPVVALESVAEVRNILPSDNPTHAKRTACVLPEHPAYYIYTSGSTGTPKCVMGLHSGLVSRIGWAQEVYLPGKNRVLARSSINFIDGLTEMLEALLSGAALIVTNPTAVQDTSRLAQQIVHTQPDLMTMVPSLLSALAEQEDILRSASICGSCKSSGEALTASHAARVSAILPGIDLLNLYGCSECSGDSTFDFCRGLDVSIGTPIWNTCIYIVDQDLGPTPLGVTGEICISGVGLARGYFGRPDLTAERFIPDPYGMPGSRMYRTGDLGRMRRDGKIQFVGRADDQVKIRGHRVEIGEIESTLMAFPAIDRSVVALAEDQLVAYVVPKTDGPLDLSVVRGHLRNSLPGHMVPARFELVAELPLTASGKLDRKALRMLERRTVDYLAPRTREEMILCELFAEILKVAQIGVNDSFFELGGHSLLAARLMTRIRQELGVEPGVRLLFEAPTVRELVSRVKALESGTKAFDSVLPLRSNGKLPAVFCLPPASGLGWTYVGLLRDICRDRPIYALQESSTAGETSLWDNIDAAAQYYIALMKALQPSGPYYLVGWSFGGMVAHDIACRLQERGDTIALLCLLDIYPPSDSDRWVDSKELSPESLDPVPIGINEHVGLGSEERQRISHAMKKNQAILRKYHPRRFDGDIVLFVAKENVDRWPSWRPHLAGRLIVHETQFHHQDIGGSDGIRVVGKTLGDYLERASQHADLGRADQREPKGTDAEHEYNVID
jgi:amino acid adenylation domain-containing protein